jgi:uncharacterized membrane protein YccC
VDRAPDLRASDRDREAVADALREHAAQGRLDHVELDERLDAVYAARTYGELDRVTADLPELPPPEPRQPRFPSPLLPTAIRLALLDLLCLFIWLSDGAHGSFWPGYVILLSAILLVRRWAKLRGIEDHGALPPPPPPLPPGRRR